MIFGVRWIVRFLFFVSFCLCDEEENITIGVIVKPTLQKSVDIMYEIDKYYDKLRYIKDNKQVHDEFVDVLKDFYNSNTCLTYELDAYDTKTKDENNDNNNNNELIISIDLDVIHKSDNSVLNINILDNDGNLLRRRLNLLDLQFQILLSIDSRKVHEIYICFENEINGYLANEEILLNLQLQFGIPSIMNSFDKSTNEVANNFNFVKVERELDSILLEFNEKLLVNESLLRNVNESNLEMVTQFGIILICGLILFNLSSLIWLVRYLKARKLIT